MEKWRNKKNEKKMELGEVKVKLDAYFAAAGLGRLSTPRAANPTAGQHRGAMPASPLTCCSWLQTSHLARKREWGIKWGVALSVWIERK